MESSAGSDIFYHSRYHHQYCITNFICHPHLCVHNSLSPVTMKIKGTKSSQSHQLFQLLLLVSVTDAFVPQGIRRFPLPSVSKKVEDGPITIPFRVDPGNKNAMSKLEEQDRPRRRDRFQRDM